MLHKKLTNLANDQLDSEALKPDKFRSSSTKHQKKRGRSQSPSPKNESIMQNLKKGKGKSKKNEKSLDAKLINNTPLVDDQRQQQPEVSVGSSVRSSQNSKKVAV